MGCFILNTSFNLDPLIEVLSSHSLCTPLSQILPTSLFFLDILLLSIYIMPYKDLRPYSVYYLDNNLLTTRFQCSTTCIILV
jgi:hypothetical protein